MGHLCRFQKSAELLNHNLLDVLGACFSGALSSASGVCFVDGIAKNHRSRLQVGDLDTRLLIGVLCANEKHLGPTCLFALRNSADLVVSLAAINYNSQRHFFV